VSQTSKLRGRSDLLKLYEWFLTTVEPSLPSGASVSHEVSAEGRDPASLVMNLDTQERVATAQVWDTGDIYLECLDAETEGTVLREHFEALDEPEIKEHLARFVSVVCASAT
jgi:hypothetical protein